MVKNKDLTQNQKDLMRRYLIWCYKTTKEDLDRVDRYFTQNFVDNFILADLKKSKEYKSSEKNDFKKLVDGFSEYMNKKQGNAVSKKFFDKEKQVLSCDYLYLNKRFLSVENAISYFFGIKELQKIRREYEKEMTMRIWQSREHT